MAYQSARSLEELFAFVSVVEANGFTAAARLCGVRKATLSLRIADLERRLGVPLLIRTTRSIRLTQEGRAYFQHAEAALRAARDAEAVVSSAKDRPSGLLRVTAPTSIAERLVAEVVTPYLRLYPEVKVRLDSTSRQQDLAREEIDIAIRLGPLKDSDLVGRKIGRSGGGYFASPGYLERRGVPELPADLARHDTIGIGTGDVPAAWTFFERGKRRSVAVQPRLVLSSFELGACAAAEDLGVLRAPDEPVTRFLESGQLIRILAEWSPPPAELFALTPPGTAALPKTRAFLDLLAQWRVGDVAD